MQELSKDANVTIAEQNMTAFEESAPLVTDANFSEAHRKYSEKREALKELL